MSRPRANPVTYALAQLVLAVACTEPNPAAFANCIDENCTDPTLPDTTADGGVGPGPGPGRGSASSGTGTGLARTTGDHDMPGDTTGRGETGTSSTSTTGMATGTETGNTSTGTFPDLGPDLPPPPACDDGRACIDGPPDGWDGPVALHRLADGDAPSCAAGYEELQLTAGSAVIAEDADCENACRCTRAAQGRCGSSVILRQWGSNERCSRAAGAFFEATVSTTRTLTLSEDGANYWSVPYVTGVSAGRCSGANAEDTPSPAELGDRISLCAPTEPTSDGCEPSQHCAGRPAAPLEAPLCIWRRGNVACPLGGIYDQRTVYYEGFDDDRRCTTCTCEARMPRCRRAVSFAQGFASLGGTGLSSLGWCGRVGAPGDRVTSANLTVQTTQGACVPNEVEPTGAATPAGPVTVCCASDFGGEAG